MSSQELNQLGTDIRAVYKISAILALHELAENTDNYLKDNHSPSSSMNVSQFQEILDAEIKKLEKEKLNERRWII